MLVFYTILYFFVESFISNFIIKPHFFEGKQISEYFRIPPDIFLFARCYKRFDSSVNYLYSIKLLSPHETKIKITRHLNVG